MVKGFIVGLALTIIIGQVPKVLGIEKGTGNFFEQAGHIIRKLGAQNRAEVAARVSAHERSG